MKNSNKCVAFCAGLVTFSFLFLAKDKIFPSGELGTWNLVRQILAFLMVALIVSGTTFFFCERKQLKPYFAKLLQYKFLLYQLVHRDFKAKYKRSILGVIWSILNPLATMLVMTIVFSTIFRFDIDNFPVYLISGQVVFNLFCESTNMCMNSILDSAALIKKVSVPKYIFPLSRAISSLVNFGFSLLSLVLVMLITGAPFHLSLFAILLPIGYVFIFSLGVGMMLSCMMVFFRDVSYLYGILMTALSYLTPLFYPISIIPDYFRFLVSINPLYHFVECFRTVVLYGGLPSLWQNVVCLLLGMLALGGGLIMFYKNQDRFILYI